MEPLHGFHKPALHIWLMGAIQDTSSVSPFYQSSIWVWMTDPVTASMRMS